MTIHDPILLSGEVTAIEAIDDEPRCRRYNVTVQGDHGTCINVETTQRLRIDQRVSIALRFNESEETP